jgi:hypothetical protein
MPFYNVCQGDYLSKIAHEHGFSDWRTIYNHPQNESFRAKRPNPNVIFPGDRLFLPDTNAKEELCETGRVHRFKLQTCHNSLHVILKDAHGNPYRNTPYVLKIAGRTVSGTTDADGAVREPKIPPNLEQATLQIAGHTMTLSIGHLDPLDAEDDGLAGMQGRLRNLGYYSGAVTGTMDDETREAIRAFREEYELGEDPAALKAKLCEKHGC